MAEVKKIQCPACGSNSTFKLFDGTYQCNYCSSNFLVKEENKQAEVKPNVEVNRTPQPIAKPYYIVIGGFFIFFIFVVTFFYQGYNLITGSNDEPSIATITKQPIVKFTAGFVGTKGTCIWIITENYSIKDSVFYELQIVNPVTNTTLKKLTFIAATKIDDANFYKNVGNKFYLYNDLAFNISDNNGMVAYNIYTGNVEINQQTLSKQNKELQEGILKADPETSTNKFLITTITGEKFIYNPLTSKIELTKSAKVKSDIITTELYLSDGLKHQLYLFTKKGDGFPILFDEFIGDSYVTRLNKENIVSVRDIFGNINLQKVSDKDFFRADPMFKDDDGSLILMYKTNLSDNADIVLESINKKGQSNWSVKDTLLQKIKQSLGSENLVVSFTNTKKTLIIYFPNVSNQYLGVDIATGKKLWYFDADKFMTEKLKSDNKD